MLHLAPVLTLLLFGPLPTANAPLPQGDEAHSRADSQTLAGDSRHEVGLKVAVDPATGQIISEPTEADLEVLAEGARRVRRPSPYLLRSFDLDNGGEGVFLDGWADHALEVTVDADGTLRVACSQGDEHDSQIAPPPASDDEENLR